MMKGFLALSVFASTLAFGIVASLAAELVYPSAPRDSKNDVFWGVAVPNPYRWLENVNSPATRAWVDGESRLSRSYLDAIPERAAIKERFRKLVDFSKAAAPERAGDRWFTFRNSGLQNQDVLYVRDGLHGRERVLLDANAFSKDGTVALGPEHSFTKDGRYLAYAKTTAGSDWEVWHVRDVTTARDLPDTLRWSKFSYATWIGDRGFYYAGFPKPSVRNATVADVGKQRLWFHRIGTPQSADRLVYVDPNPTEYTSILTTEDERYVLRYRYTFNGESLAWKRRAESDAAFKPLFPFSLDATFKVLGDDGNRLYIYTDAGAARGRVVWVDVTDAKHRLHSIVPQAADQLQDASLIGDTFYLQYLHDAHASVLRSSLSGTPLGRLELPGTLGSGGLPLGRRRDATAYYTFQSYTVPEAVYAYDTKTDTSAAVEMPKIRFDSSAYVTQLDFAVSEGGTRVPVYVTHRAGARQTGLAPTLVYTYGGFDVALVPTFDPATALWLQMGGTYAVICPRGGGEYGQAWYRAGKLANKQHTIDDVIAGTRMLVARGFASSPKLAIDGESNGGFVVGATMTQQPALFAATIPEVGVMDMLRYQRWTVGKKWISEYGSADASAADFKYLHAISPIDNIRPGIAYPATLVMVSDHDDRVYPAHSFKFTATLQHDQAGSAPILMRVESNGGHGWGRPLGKIIDDVADRYAFLTKTLNFTPTL
jgi:prolyl oligopeptidase